MNKEFELPSEEEMADAKAKYPYLFPDVMPLYFQELQMNYETIKENNL